MKRSTRTLLAILAAVLLALAAWYVRQMCALAQIDEAASIWLSGWDAATLMMTGGNDRDN